MRTRTLLGLLTLTTSLVGPLAAAEVPERTTIVSRDGGVVMEAAPPDDARRQVLEAWHRLYVRRGRPLERRAAELVAAGAAGEDVAEGCRELARALIEAEEIGVLDPPHFAVRHHVRAGFGRLAHTATACWTGHLPAAREHRRRAALALAQADRLLLELGL
jgi:hypothetical protein